MKLSRTAKDNLKDIFLIALAWSTACLIFITFRYVGMDREVSGADVSYFTHEGKESGVSTMVFDVNLRRAYFEFIVGGFLGGMLAGMFEILVFPRSFRRQRFTTVLLTKILFYNAVMVLAVLIVEPLTLLTVWHPEGDFWDLYFRQMNLFFRSSLFHIAILLVTIVGSLTTVFRQLSSRLGHGVMRKIVTGKYHTPREEVRVFLFCDLKNSTVIAEHLGHLRFGEFLKEYYYEISDAIHRNNGEVDQYIGDEVVVTWPGEGRDASADAIQCHFDMLQRLEELAPVWEKKYGIAPMAKSGIHVGKVITTEVGVFKRSVLYLGDTVNTAARIQAECNAYQKTVLFSGEILKVLRLPAIYVVESLGSAVLKGKELPVKLYSVAVRE